MNKISKVMALLVVLTFVTGVFAGCAGEKEDVETPAATEKQIDDNTTKEAEPVTLRISTMFGGTDPSTQVFEEQLVAFEELHPHVTIKNESMTSVGDEYRTKVKTDFATGNEADITFFYNGADVQGIINSDKVISYDEINEKYPEVGKDITDGVKDSVREEDGKLYMMPLTGFYEGLFVNEAIFEQYGLELPTTWENLITAIDVLKENDIVPFAGPIAQSHYMIEHFVLSQAGAEGHKDVLAGDEPSADWVAAFNNIKDLYEKEAFAKDALTMDIEMAQNLFIQEKAAMILEGSWFIGRCEDELKDKMTVIPMATASDKMDPTSIIGGFSSGYYVSKSSYEDPAKQQAVIDLVSFLTSAEAIKDHAAVNGGSPAAKVVVEGLHPLFVEGHAMVANANTLNMPIDSRLTPEAFNILVKDGIPFIVEGRKNPEEVLKATKEKNER
ncbi:ABC transporter substrate-binding protein [Vallitalea okinawensis]|uniref:ABC transporter substrate-binding protein n=1 Tax=Vallitalea okinawensis TaxID=2078660 RepID=UPI000CFB693D|nr:extracellular solute-binding protein [Vallitalea okinawensis]